ESYREWPVVEPGDGRQRIRRLDQVQPEFGVVLLDLLLPGIGRTIIRDGRSRDKDVDTVDPVVRFREHLLGSFHTDALDIGRGRQVHRPADQDDPGAGRSSGFGERIAHLSRAVIADEAYR